MATKHPRVNVTLDKLVLGALAEIARQQDKSVSEIAAQLIAQALEQQEDFLLSKLAAKRDDKKAKRIPHERAWG